jgi:ADP-heptose:LPS heptosyltransferase
VIFFANGYGDTVMVQPTLRGLAQELRGFKTLIFQKGSHAFLTQDLGFDRVVSVPMWSAEGGRMFDAEALASAVGPCDGFLALVPWESRALKEIRRLLNPKVSIGHFSGYDIQVPLDRGFNNIELNFEFVRLFNPAANISEYWFGPTFSPPVRAFVDDLMAALPAGSTTLAVHADTTEEKMWSDQGWQELLEIFLTDRPSHFVFVVGHEIRNVLPRRHSERVIPLQGLNLEASMCVVANSDVFAGIDSCMLHVADLCGRPGFGIFKSTNPSEFGFFRSPNVQLLCGTKALSDEISEYVDALAIVDRIYSEAASVHRPKRSKVAANDAVD